MKVKPISHESIDLGNDCIYLGQWIRWLSIYSQITAYVNYYSGNIWEPDLYYVMDALSLTHHPYILLCPHIEIYLFNHAYI